MDVFQNETALNVLIYSFVFFFFCPETTLVVGVDAL